MIRRRTVLVLGAGASKPYGYPLGGELKEGLCKEPKTIGEEQRVRLLRELGHMETEIREFIRALSMSGKPSVDAFLEHRTEFMEIGKRFIAAWLIPEEVTAYLMNPSEIYPLGPRPNWYEYLFNKMNARREEFVCNNLAVVTFNYDRSLEQYLFTALQNSYGLSEGESADLVKNVPIIHVHGQLGYLPWQADGGRPYEPSKKASDISEAARMIKVVHQDIGRDREFGRARAMIDKAERIIFLGFGWHDENLERLGLKDLDVTRPMWGSTLGLEAMEVFTLCQKWTCLSLHDSGFENLTFLRKKVVLD